MKKSIIISINTCVIFLFCLNSMAQTQVPDKAPQKPQILADSAKSVDKKDTLVTDTAKSAFGKLHITSRPDSSQVIVDSAIQGIAPLFLDSIAPGMHTILVKNKGYFVKKISVVVRPYATEEIAVFLVRPGSVFVKSDPAGAQCFMDGKESGKTPCEIAKLKPGDYDLSLHLFNRAAQERRITVTESKCDTLSFNLPFTQAYLDSVAAFKKVEKEKTARKNRTRNYVVAGVFGAFAVAILIMEAVDR